MPTTLANLPLITRFLYTHDNGPTDGGRDCAICPHCGSKGRYIHYFVCEDGNQYGAMSGCIKLFPISEIASTDKALRERLTELQKAYGADATLNSWGKRMREAIDAFYAGEMSQAECLSVIKREKQAQATYRAYKNRRR